MTTGDFDFDEDEFNVISLTAKDFIEKLLVKQPKYVTVTVSHWVALVSFHRVLFYAHS